MNLYDDFRPDVAALLKEQDAKLPAPDPRARSGDRLGALGRLRSLAALYALGAQVKTGLHRRLVYTNLRLDWFQEFQDYWMGELGNRPIHPHDFYFLSGVYRQRAQTLYFEHLERPDLASDDKHLDAWRDSRMVSYLFLHAYRLALSPLRVHPFTRWVPRGGRVAEYGCGAAPIVTSLARYYGHLDLRLVGADIPHLLFHYARWKFRADRFVTMVPIQPNDDVPLPGEYDTIFCLETFEHLPRPIAAAQHLHRALTPGGCLVFDYVRSDGTGLDTAAALRDRIPALEFILKRFDIVQGRVTTDGAHIEPAVARKR
ncbi:MAG: class I SAM-dependent methyltransferase [Candidatus Rokubacteria bacterium]|nr:class I SAM-dependent methyltransferase [Candidatus Rokubacteria bacterium]